MSSSSEISLLGAFCSNSSWSSDNEDDDNQIPNEYSLEDLEDCDDTLSEMERGNLHDSPSNSTIQIPETANTKVTRKPTAESDSSSAVTVSSVITMLDMIRLNCINCSDYHNQNYQWYKATFNYYRVPVVILSACNAFVVSATKPYFQQTTIDTISTIISLIVGIITGLELFFNLQVNTEAERVSHKKYYMLAVEIMHTLHLYQNNPAIDLFSYANQKLQDYLRINASSSVITENVDDLMTPAQLPQQSSPSKLPKLREKKTLLRRLRNPNVKKMKHVLSKWCRPQKHRHKQKKQNQQIVHAGLQLLHRHLDTSKSTHLPTSPVGVDTDIPSLFSVPASSAYMTSSYTSPIISPNSQSPSSQSPNSRSPNSQSPKIIRPLRNKRKIHPKANINPCKV